LFFPNGQTFQSHNLSLCAHKWVSLRFTSAHNDGDCATDGLKFGRGYASALSRFKLIVQKFFPHSGKNYPFLFSLWSFFQSFQPPLPLVACRLARHEACRPTGKTWVWLRSQTRVKVSLVVRSSIPRRIEKQEVDFVELSFSKISFWAKTFLPFCCFSQFISPRRASKISSADELVCSCRAPVVAGRQTSHLLKNFFEGRHGRGLIGFLGLFPLTPLPRFAHLRSPRFVVIYFRAARPLTFNLIPITLL